MIFEGKNHIHLWFFGLDYQLSCSHSVKSQLYHTHQLQKEIKTHHIEFPERL